MKKYISQAWIKNPTPLGETQGVVTLYGKRKLALWPPDEVSDSLPSSFFGYPVLFSGTRFSSRNSSAAQR